MKAVVLLCALALTGCAGGARLLPRGVSGNETYVTVSNVWNSADALKAADAHCHQFGRAAHFNHMEGYTASFDCVKVD